MTNPRNQLKRVLNNKLNVPHPVTGTLGTGDGQTVVDTELENHVWVRIHGQGVASVLNKHVSPVYGRRVLVGVDPFEPNVTQILGTWTDQPDGEGNGAGLNYAPASRYRWMAPDGGEDPLYVELRQFLPLRVGMSDPAALSVSVYRGMLWSGTAWLAINSQTVDLTGYVPTTSGKALLALISLDTSGTPVVTAGSEVDLTALALTDLPAVPEDTAAALAAVRLFEGQTAVQEARTNTDIIDLRFSGWGTGGGTITVREQDGSPSVSASVIEFATGTTVSDQGGGVARVTPPTGGPGGDVPAAVRVYLNQSFR